GPHRPAGDDLRLGGVRDLALRPGAARFDRRPARNRVLGQCHPTAPRLRTRRARRAGAGPPTGARLRLAPSIAATDSRLAGGARLSHRRQFGVLVRRSPPGAAILEPPVDTGWKTMFSVTDKRLTTAWI